MDEAGQLIALLKTNGIGLNSSLIFEIHLPEVEDDSIGDDLAGHLQRLVGWQGLVAVPTCTSSHGYPKPAFDPLFSPSEVGRFSNYFMRLPGVVRSNNASHSVALWGAQASAIAAGHRYATGRQTPWGESPFGIGSPWERLYDLNAWWVSLDPDWLTSPFTGLLLAFYRHKLEGVTRWTPFPEFDAQTLSTKIAELPSVFIGAWNRRRVFIFRLKTVVDSLLSEFETNPDQLGPSKDFRDWLDLRAILEQDGYVTAGLQRTIITPPVPFARWDGKSMTGIARDLYARVLVFSFQGTRFALVVCDLVGMERNLVGEIRRRAGMKTGLQEEEILITCTHAHSTPDTIAAGYADKSFLEFLVERIVSAIEGACSNPEPVRIGWQKTTLRGLARSRRQKMKDGKVFTTRYSVPSTWRVEPGLVASEGAIDPELTVIRVEKLDGETLAVVSNFGCHPSVALASSNASGDFTGEAMAVLEEVLGENSLAFCTNGAAGDVDPTLEMPYWGPRNDRNARRIGRIYAAQVLETLERIEVYERIDLGRAQVLLDLPVREDWLQLLGAGREQMQAEYAAGWELSPGIAAIIAEKKIHTEIQAFRLGSLTLVAFPGEVLSETSLELKSQFSQRSLVVIELANDYIGYIPTPSAFGEGGYECGLHFSARIPPDAYHQIFQAAERAIGLANPIN